MDKTGIDSWQSERVAVQGAISVLREKVRLLSCECTSGVHCGVDEGSGLNLINTMGFGSTKLDFSSHWSALIVLKSDVHRILTTYQKKRTSHVLKEGDFIILDNTQKFTVTSKKVGNKKNMIACFIKEFNRYPSQEMIERSFLKMM